MILPLGITAVRTRILPTIELNSLPLLIKECCFKILPPSSYNFSARVYGVPLYVGLLTMGVVLLHHIIHLQRYKLLKKVDPFITKRAHQISLTWAYAHTLLFLGNTLY